MAKRKRELSKAAWDDLHIPWKRITAEEVAEATRRYQAQGGQIERLPGIVMAVAPPPTAGFSARTDAASAFQPVSWR